MKSRLDVRARTSSTRIAMPAVVQDRYTLIEAGYELQQDTLTKNCSPFGQTILCSLRRFLARQSLGRLVFLWFSLGRHFCRCRVLLILGDQLEGFWVVSPGSKVLFGLGSVVFCRILASIVRQETQTVDTSHQSAVGIAARSLSL